MRGCGCRASVRTGSAGHAVFRYPLPGLSSPAAPGWQPQSALSPCCPWDFLVFLCTWHRAVHLAWPLRAPLFPSGAPSSWDWAPGLPWLPMALSPMKNLLMAGPCTKAPVAGPASGTSSTPALTTRFAHLLPGFRGNEPARGLVSRVHRRHAWTRHTKARSIFASFPLAHFCLKAYNCTACLIYICP